MVETKFKNIRVRHGVGTVIRSDNECLKTTLDKNRLKSLST